MLLCGVVFVIVSACTNGLVVGLGDQDIHEVFVHAAAGSDTFDADLLSSGGSSHPSLVFWVLAAARGLFSADIVGFVGVLGLLFATGVAVGLLARAMAPTQSAAWVLASACAAPSQLVLGGAPTVDPLLLPRLVALPLELWAVSLVIQRRWGLALGLTSFALVVHAPSASALLVAALISYGVVGPRRMGPLVLVALGLLPALWILDWGAMGPVSLSDDAWRLVEARLAHHLVPTSWTAGLWVAAGAWALGALTLTGRLSGRSQVRALLLGLFVWGLIAGTAGALLRAKILLNLEPWQGARLIALIAVTAASCVALHMPRRVRLVSALALFGSCVALASPRWKVGEADWDISTLGAWAQSNTEVGALFVVPPDLTPGFRVAAQRPIYGQWKDGGEVQFDPALGLRWASRMRSLCACAPFVDLPAESSPFHRSQQLRRELGASYDNRATEDLLALARTAGASWLVRRDRGDRSEGAEVVGPYLVIPVDR